MKKIGEILLAGLILTAMYCSIPASKPNPLTGDHIIANSTTDQVVLLADGTDPMPGKR
jgi:hypothetical protein